MNPSEYVARYRVVRQMASGGMGDLYLAHDADVDRPVVIKLLRDRIDSPQARERFVQEGRAAGKLRHKNIVTVFEVGEWQSRPWIAMEYVSGETLAQKIARGAAIPLAERLRYIEDLCSGLDYAHRHGVIHRDVKPHNVMVDDEDLVKILDFGVAHVADSEITLTGALVGTPNYMAPEQIAGREVDARTDVFAVGAVLYELLSYRRAFPGDIARSVHQIVYGNPEPLDRVLPSIDRRLLRVVECALAKAPEQRYSDLRSMAAEIKSIRDSFDGTIADETIVLQPAQPALDPPESGPEVQPARAFTVRHRLALGGMLVVVAAAGLSLLLRERPAMPESAETTTTAAVPADAQGNGTTRPTEVTSAPPTAATPSGQSTDATTNDVGRSVTDAPPPPTVERPAPAAQQPPASSPTTPAQEVRPPETPPASLPSVPSPDTGAAGRSGAPMPVGSPSRGATAETSPAVTPESNPQPPSREEGGPGRRDVAVLPPPAAPAAGVDTATRPPIAPANVDDRSAIEEALNEYRRAYEARDLSRVQRVFPALPNAAAVRTALEEAREVLIGMSPPDIRIVSPVEATASCRLNQSFVPKVGTARAAPTRNVTFTLRKDANRWVIVSLR